MRLDKYLCEMNIGSRSEVKQLLKAGLVQVNGAIVKKPEQKIDPYRDVVLYKGQRLEYTQFYYYMLNKPEGVVSATCDNTAPTVISLLGEHAREDIFPVGRLDKDTTGLLLLTNDGALAHQLLSPKKHVDKTYYVTTRFPVNQAQLNMLEDGVDIGEEKKTLPAKAEMIDANHMYLTIQEGKFHQVKRMLQAVDNGVTALKRVAFGPLSLDPNLSLGEYRVLTEEEIQLLKR